MSPRSRRRTTKPAARRASTQRQRDAAPRVPRPRQAAEESSARQVEPFVTNDDALVVLHRAAEDPAFQRFLDELPIVHLVGRFLDWVGDSEDAEDPENSEDADTEAPLRSEASLNERLGIEPVGCTAVERWRPRVLSMACARWGLVSLTEDHLERDPDVMGWSAADPLDRAWARSLVVAAAIECSVRYVATHHIAGDEVQHTLATMLAASAGEDPWPLGLLSALRPDDVLAQHVDRVVLEHVAELRAWGVLADGEHLRVAHGAEPLLRSLAINLSTDLLPPTAE